MELDGHNRITDQLSHYDINVLNQIWYTFIHLLVQIMGP